MKPIFERRYTPSQVCRLNQIEHDRSCKWFDDCDWNSATFTNYMNNYGDYPECTCAAGREIVGGSKP